MKTLYKWYLTNEGIVGYMAHGIVYGHSSPHCADGSEIHTSLIESAEYDGESITLFTMNSEYRLSISEMDCECFDALRSLHIFEKFAREHGLLQCFPQVTDHYRELDGFLRRKRSEVHSRLNDGSLYIEFSNENKCYFNMGIYRTITGETDFFPKMTDFFIDKNKKVVGSLNYIVEFSPYNGGNIEFISHSRAALPNKEFLGIIRNSSRRSLNIRFSWGKTVILAPDTEISVSEGMGLAIPLTDTSQDIQITPY